MRRCCGSTARRSSSTRTAGCSSEHPATRKPCWSPTSTNAATGCRCSPSSAPAGRRRTADSRDPVDVADACRDPCWPWRHRSRVDPPHAVAPHLSVAPPGHPLVETHSLVTSVVHMGQHHRRLCRSTWVSQSVLRHLGLIRSSYSNLSRRPRQRRGLRRSPGSSSSGLTDSKPVKLPDSPVQPRCCSWALQLGMRPRRWCHSAHCLVVILSGIPRKRCTRRRRGGPLR
jgi:hypothetical protein